MAEAESLGVDPGDPSIVRVPQEDRAASLSNLEIGDTSSDEVDTTSIKSSTVSIRSSIYNYIEENGRTYHAYNSGKYMLPNDEREQNRLDLQHHSFRIMLDGRLGIAPVDNPKDVLDIATGTGIWAIEYAQEHPDSSVIGTDLSPIQPAYVPKNLHFQVDDAEDDWTFTKKFDYIHARAIMSCFNDNRAIAQKIFNALTPGGYFELQDPSLPMRSDDGSLDNTALGEWNVFMYEGMAKIGRNLMGGADWAQILRDVGFDNVVEHKMYIPISPWAKGRKNKILGALSQQNLAEGIFSMSTALFTRVLGWDMERFETFMDTVKADAQKKDIHAYGVVYFVYGRKPEEVVTQNVEPAG